MEYTKGEQCTGWAYDPTGWGRPYQCTKRAVVERDGKPYCKIHDPEYIKTKKQAKEEQWDRELEERRVKTQRHSLIASVFEGIDTKTIAATVNVYRAAPDLYEACKEGLDFIRGLRQLMPESDIEIGMQQALAKAEVK